ncbi:MAG: DNA mismatch repair protein MutS [Clostridia bacterium]|nr:DNA mismatch repair protein MutS [Clostridia bacterium]
MAGYSPMMQHYLDVKEEYKDCIIFYRLGDFYEMFFDDAITASRELEITLTGRDCGQEERAPMCGVPFHAAESYIAKLIEKGYKVAICEQLEDPKEAKGIVKRDVIRVVTPGTVIEANLLEEKKNNYIMSVYKKGIYFSLAICDITTGEFLSTKIEGNNNFETLLDELSKYNPAEIVINKLLFDCKEEVSQIKLKFNTYINCFNEDLFNDNIEELQDNYSFEDDGNNKINDLKNKEFELQATNGLLKYLNQTQKIKLEHINVIKIYSINKYMSLNLTTRRNLELTEKLHDKTKKGTLLWVLDKTSTSMGGRMLRKWINEPLIDVTEINKRLNAVSELKDNIILRGDIVYSLKTIYDIERLVGKIAYGNCNARDMISLKNSLKNLPNLKKLLAGTKSELLQNLYIELDELEDIFDLIERAIVEEPPITIKEGGIIKLGYNEQVDEYKKATIEGKNWLIELENREREETGIKNLRIGFNKVFGYFFEVTKSYLGLVPEKYIRKQTLANCERYITEELNELESTILGAEEKVVTLEYNLFVEIRNAISKNIERLQKTANIISILDTLSSFAIIAEEMDYVRPNVNDIGTIDIKDGRHPVIEKIIPSGTFVQNDTYLDKQNDRFSIITGPNMAGKSTYMRQVALITLMAQIGSFVPATSATIGVVDKIFTRVGASDDLSMGQSTFMVEMMEVAEILREATSKSLIILDEIGRGTSTYDGLSIAWAVVEYITDKEKIGAKTLFATHYHELTELEEKIEGVRNYSIAVKEKGEDVIFLRKIVNGGTDESYGVHVAKLAGVPQDVIKKSNEILRNLERKSILGKKNQEKENKKIASGQLDLYNYKLAEVAHEIDKINLNELTPIDALNILVRIKDKIK